MMGSFTFHLLYYRDNTLPYAMNRENLGMPHSWIGRSGEDISWPLPKIEFTLQNVSPKFKKKKPYRHTRPPAFRIWEDYSAANVHENSHKNPAKKYV
jgi:hypothetical protein